MEAAVLTVEDCAATWPAKRSSKNILSMNDGSMTGDGGEKETLKKSMAGHDSHTRYFYTIKCGVPKWTRDRGIVPLTFLW